MTFAGWGVIHGKRVDLTLAERLVDLGATELGMQEVTSIVAQTAAETFSILPSSERHHTFTIAGYRTIDNKPEPQLLTLSNVADGGFGVAALDHFAVRAHHRRDDATPFVATGSGATVITRGERVRLGARLRAVYARGELNHTSVNDIEDGIVSLIRSAAERAGNTVGKDCMAISITPVGDVRALYYPEGRLNPRTYGPLCLWSAGGRNLFIGDLEVDRGAGYSIVVGGDPATFRVLVGSSDGQRRDPSTKLVTKFRLKFSDSKFGKPVENLSFVSLESGSAFRQ